MDISNYSGPKVDIQPSELSNFEGHNWVLEPKIDGMWVEMHVRNPAQGRPHIFLSRKSIAPHNAFTYELSLIELPLPEGSILCGELEAGTDRATKRYAEVGFYALHLFDIVSVGNFDTAYHKFNDRRIILEKMYREINFMTYHKLGRFLLVPNAHDLFHQRYEHIISNGGEGVILKNTNAPYSFGKTDDMVRCKDYITDDFVLMDIGTTDSGALTGVWGQYHNNKLVYVMRAQPNDISLLNPIHLGVLVAEFKGWGRQSSGTLRSAQFQRIRTDKSPQDCVLKNVGNKTPTRRK